MLRRQRQLELVAVLISAALVSVASPTRNELWWSVGAILAAVATLVTLRRAVHGSASLLGSHRRSDSRPDGRRHPFA